MDKIGVQRIEGNLFLNSSFFILPLCSNPLAGRTGLLYERANEKIRAHAFLVAVLRPDVRQCAN
jgi:hypothetical protein